MRYSTKRRGCRKRTIGRRRGGMFAVKRLAHGTGKLALSVSKSIIMNEAKKGETSKKFTQRKQGNTVPEYIRQKKSISTS